MHAARRQPENMSGIRALAILALLASAACTKSDRKDPPAATDTSDPTADRHPLAGSWQVATTVRNYGLVVAQVTITDERWIMATIQALGVSRSIQARLESFTGDELTVAYLGQERTVPARLVDGRLRLIVPGVGEFTLTRP